MPFPDWVEKQKRQGCEIKKIKDHYYMYERKSIWDPIRKKPKKVTGTYLGKVTPDGIISPKNHINSPIFSIEYGATSFLAGLTTDLFHMLSKHFDQNDAACIWIIAMLKLMSPCPFKRIAARYEASWISRLLPDLPLSPASITGLLDRIGGNRAACAAFMRETMEPAPYLLIDGTGTMSASKSIQRALLGYSRGHGFIPQVNQVYVLSVSASGPAPAFYRNIAGNIPDVSAFELTIEDAGVKGATIIADAGFASADNFEILKKAGLNYIIPLKRNTSDIKLAQIEYEKVFTYHHRAISAHAEEKGGYKICVFRDEKLRADEMVDFVERKEKANATVARKKNFNPDKDLHDVTSETKAKNAAFGTIILRTSLVEADTQKVYEIYKLRWEIEQLFDTMRNTCDADTSYMQDDAGFEAWSFINHVTLIAACRVLALIRSKGMLKNWSLAGVMDYLSRLNVIQIAGEWKLAEVTKNTQKMLNDLDISFDLHANLLPNH